VQHSPTHRVGEAGEVSDPFDLRRFVDAQASTYDQALAELRAGEKRSHWMWFIFPQIAGLGRSEKARKFAVASLAEAEAYLARPKLGARLCECTSLVLSAENRSATDIFGPIDGLKFHSSMTLFAAAFPEGGLFRAALDRFFSSEPDPLTLDQLSRQS
jgi:uncharacterized protein (DUF1810 family)